MGLPTKRSKKKQTVENVADDMDSYNIEQLTENALGRVVWK